MKRNKIHSTMLRFGMHASWVILFSLFLGCNKTLEPDLSKVGYAYYPTNLGEYRIYFTQRIDYNINGSVDTTRYITKEFVEDSIKYSDGSLRFLLGRYSAELGSTSWHKDSLWAVEINQTNVITSESNIDYIKLAFPVEENLKWDGNARNSKNEELYELKDVNKPYSYDTLNYENTLTVVQADLIDPAKLTNDDYRIEVYAADIGLVYKLRKKINYCDPTKCSVNGTIEDGIIFEQKLIGFGKE